MPETLEFLSWTLLGNTVQDWLLATGAFVLVFGALFGLRRVVGTRFARRAAATEQRVDDFLLELIRRTRFFFATVLGLLVASRFLEFSERAERLLGRVFVLLLLLQIGMWANSLLSFWLRHYTRQRISTDAATVTTVRAVLVVVKVLIWAILFLAALQTFGVNVTALIAGLGIGGIAVALAVQSILGDMIASFSIVLDKPFAVGDFIVVDQMSGTVEEVKLKTTRIRSLSGEQLIVSNTDLARARIRNYKRMAERRIAFTISVQYDTPVDTMEQLPVIIREVIAETPNTRFDRSHFSSFGESGLMIETIYFVLSPEYGMYMDIQQHLNLAIMRRFEALGVKFAFPTRTLMVSGAEQDGNLRALVRMEPPRSESVPAGS